MASQKFTIPRVTGAAADFTIAVSVTTVPAFTVVTAGPPAVTASVTEAPCTGIPVFTEIAADLPLAVV